MQKRSLAIWPFDVFRSESETLLVERQDCWVQEEERHRVELQRQDHLHRAQERYAELHLRLAWDVKRSIS